jgi:hypothetical protein
MTLSETFDAVDWQTITSLVELKQEENLHLDFKLVANSDLTNKDDKRNFAKALSGFSNSSGGIIVWGIDARKNVDGIDCATGIAEIANPALMVNRLNSLTGDATSPITGGVRHKAIINPQTGRGVVATLVPEHDSGPFMAKLGEQRYYKRSGDSFYQMEHFDLEDMFGRRQKARLEILLRHKSVENDIEQITVSILNTGRAVARHAGFLMELTNATIVTVHGPGLKNVSDINSGMPVVQYNNDTGVIHPNGVRLDLGAIWVRRIDLAQTIRAGIRMYWDGSPFVDQTIEVSLDR